MGPLDPSGRLVPQGQLTQLPQLQNAELQGVVRVMGVVSDAVGGIDDLHLDDRVSQLSFRRFLSPASLTVQHLLGQIEPGEFDVADLQQLEDPQRLGVVVEAAVPLEPLVEHVLARVPKGGVADVVPQGERLDQVLVDPQRPGHGPRQRGDLQRVGEPRAVVVSQLAGEDLGLVAQPPVGRAVDDAVPVALVGRAVRVRRLRMNATN